MIKSLRRKVFGSILLSAAGVLLLILLALNGLQWAQTASKKESILDMGLMLLQPEPMPGAGPAGGPGGPGNAPGEDFRGPRKDKAELMRSVSQDELGGLLLDEAGNILVKSGCATDLEESGLKELITAALADADGRGYAGGWEYKAVPQGAGKALAILEAASLRRENWETALLSLGGFAAACGLFALLARFLSRVIVKPVEENIEAQKRFVADASHELKTPLAVIDANISVLEQSLGENKWLGYIQEESGRMAELVNQLLQLSHLEEEGAGSPETLPPVEPFDGAEAVMAAALPFESLAFEGGLSLETDLPESLPMTGRRQDLEQLTAILIDNGIKHASQGGTLRLSLGRQLRRRGLKEEEMLALRVSNPGADIPPEALAHLFDRFYQADPARSHRKNSYGLGLAIAKKLAERNGGSIQVQSREGETAFTLLLPSCLPSSYLVK